MLQKAVKGIFIVIFIVLFTAGCWDSLDIEERDIITAVVLDKTPDGYAIVAEIPSFASKNPQSRQDASGQQTGQTDSGQANSTIVKASGQNLVEVRTNLDLQTNKPIYLGAVQSLIVTENMAKNGIREYAYRIRQDNEYRKTMDVIVTPDNPEDFLSIQPANTEGVGFAAQDLIQELYNQGMTFHMSLEDLLEKLSAKNDSYLMATLSTSSGQLKLIGYTVFDGEKSVGFIPYEASHGILYFESKGFVKPRIDYVVPLQDSKITVTAALGGKDIKVQFEEEKPVFFIDISFESTILYSSDNTPVTKQKEQEVKEKLKEMITRELNDALNTSQSTYGCDYLSFCEPFRICFPDKFENIDWKSEFKKAQFNLNVTVNLRENQPLDYNPEEGLS